MVAKRLDANEDGSMGVGVGVADTVAPACVRPEMPLCCTPQEVEELLAVQRRTGRGVGVAHTDHCHDEGTNRIKAMIEG